MRSVIQKLTLVADIDLSVNNQGLEPRALVNLRSSIVGPGLFLAVLPTLKIHQFSIFSSEQQKSEKCATASEKH